MQLGASRRREQARTPPAGGGARVTSAATLQRAPGDCAAAAAGAPMRLERGAGDDAPLLRVAPEPEAALGARARAAAPRGALSALGVAVVLFGNVAGGPFGIEPAVGAAGPLPTLVMLALAAGAWSLPQALMAAELATMMPSNAGIVEWVLRGCGPTAGFVNAWSSVLMTLCNLPLFTLLISNAVAARAPELSRGALYAVQVAALAAALLVNVAGLRAVERVGGALIVLALAPFALLPALAAARGGARAFAWGALGDAAPGWTGSLALSLSTVLWNQQGFNAVGNIAGEVRDARRDIPRGLTIAAVAVTLNYIVPVALTFPLAPAVADWGDGFFVTLAGRFGEAAGDATAFACVVSSLNNLISQLALGARALQALARARMLAPRAAAAALAADGVRFRVPLGALLAACAVCAGLMLLSFEDLVTVELLFSVIALCFQFAAFVALKFAAPDAPRPFAVPGGRAGAAAIASAFAALAVVVLYANLSEPGTIASGGAVLGVTVALAAAGAAWARGNSIDDVLEALRAAGAAAAEAADAADGAGK